MFSKEKYSCKIDRITNDGQVFIIFNTILKDTNRGVNIEDINDSVLKINVLPSQTLNDNIILKSMNRDETLDVEWNATSLVLDTLTIKIRFNTPLIISAGDDRD